MDVDVDVEEEKKAGRGGLQAAQRPMTPEGQRRPPAHPLPGRPDPGPGPGPGPGGDPGGDRHPALDNSVCMCIDAEQQGRFPAGQEARAGTGRWLGRPTNPSAAFSAECGDGRCSVPSSYRPSLRSALRCSGR